LSLGCGDGFSDKKSFCFGEFEFEMTEPSAPNTKINFSSGKSFSFEEFSFIILQESTAWPAAGCVPEGFLKVSLRIY